MKFTKMQGAGNDYLYIDARHIEKDWERLAIDMSNRHFGVGSDGIILIQSSSIADLKMRMFNADGSEGEMCGNGIRCFAKYSLDKGIIPNTEGNLQVETLAGIRDIVPIREDGIVIAARVSMGKPIFAPDDVPVVGWLVVVEGPGKGKSVNLGYGRNTVGRDKNNRSAIPFGDQEISRNNHAIITFDHKGNKFHIQQGESKNPIRVSNEIVLEPRELFGGETIELSDVTVLKFVPLCGESFSWEDPAGK